jgi:hypothetical protein
MHAIAAEVEIFKIEAKIEKGTDKKIVVGFLKPGESGICVIKVEINLFRLQDHFASRNINSCTVWVVSPSVMKESNFFSIKNYWIRNYYRHQASQNTFERAKGTTNWRVSE